MEQPKYAQIKGMYLPISFKSSEEICNFLRYKSTKRAKTILENVIEMKQAVPYKKFVKEIPHRRGKMATGRFPIKASKEILNLIKGVEANAQNTGLASDLVIKEITANKGPLQWHYGRQRRRRMKRTHIGIKVTEQKVKKRIKK